MVRALDLRQVLTGFNLIENVIVRAKVVEAPTDVAFANCRAVTPPSVVPRTLFKMAKEIDVVIAQESAHPGSFLGEKARIFKIRFWILKVDVVVRDIVVTADNDVFALSDETIQVLMNDITECQFVTKTLMLPLAIGKIAVYQNEFAVVQCQNSALSVELGNAYAHSDLVWLAF